MYFKLALGNVRKSYKDYLIYFLTLAFSVCLFYCFNSFQAQQAILDMNESQSVIMDSMVLLMAMLSGIISFILAFLIIYANNFLIKRRKKELGIYTLLGMEKRKIAKVLLYETLLIGFISLVAGIFFGILSSQFLSVITANLFDVPLNYSFIFSIDATVITCISFAIIFAVLILFNSFTLNRYKLIDLMQADKKNESLKVKNIYLSLILFILSIILLFYAYKMSWDDGLLAFANLAMIVPAGLLGTLFFFMSLSGFLLKFVQTSKSLYFRNMNMFVLRQINSSINSNFVSMSVVCVMLLFSIGALATGLNLNKTINSTIKVTTPYDFSYSSLYSSYDISNIKQDLNLEDDPRIKADSYVYVYSSDTAPTVFQESYKDTSLTISLNNQGDYEVMALSDFNKLRERFELEPITLPIDGAYMFTSAELLRESVQAVLDDKPTFTLYGKQLQIENDEYDVVGCATTLDVSTFMFGVVVNDEIIPSNTNIGSSYWNVDLQEGTDQSDFISDVYSKIHEYNDNHPNKTDYNFIDYHSTIRDEVYNSSIGISVIFTYIGLYLGIIFLVASAVVLALQQLSQASDNRQRYLLLGKIGAESSMINRSVLLQLSIYFFMPLLLAIVHSVVGIRVVNSIVVVFGSGDILLSSLLTSGIILLIYGVYFLITYIGYMRILKQPK